MTIHISDRKKKTGKVDFNQLLSGIPARDYVRQDAPYEEQIKAAANLLSEADAVVVGAGAGLSTAAGLTYGGKRFTDNFGEFIEKYTFQAPRNSCSSGAGELRSIKYSFMYMRDMYSAGFYPFPTEEAKWGYWSKHAYLNRIEPDALPLYQSLYGLIKGLPYFVLTTNVDHQFWKAGFSDGNIFATQGDYGKIQCQKGCHPKTYDAVDMFVQMNQSRKDCLVPSYMVPKCPVCGGNMAMHLRSDQYFVEDEHWHKAAERYTSFLEEHREDRVVLLELGVGFNTPTIIRFPFEQMMRRNENWSLIRLNLEEAFVPESFGKRAVGIEADIAKSVCDIKGVEEDGAK